MDPLTGCLVWNLYHVEIKLLLQESVSLLLSVPTFDLSLAIVLIWKWSCHSVVFQLFVFFHGLLVI